MQRAGEAECPEDKRIMKTHGMMRMSRTSPGYKMKSRVLDDAWPYISSSFNIIWPRRCNLSKRVKLVGSMASYDKSGQRVKFASSGTAPILCKDL